MDALECLHVGKDDCQKGHRHQSEGFCFVPWRKKKSHAQPRAAAKGTQEAAVPHKAVDFDDASKANSLDDDRAGHQLHEKVEGGGGHKVNLPHSMCVCVCVCVCALSMNYEVK